MWKDCQVQWEILRTTGCESSCPSTFAQSLEDATALQHLRDTCREACSLTYRCATRWKHGSDGTGAAHRLTPSRLVDLVDCLGSSLSYQTRLGFYISRLGGFYHGFIHQQSTSDCVFSLKAHPWEKLGEPPPSVTLLKC